MSQQMHAFYWDNLSQQMLDLNDRIPEHTGWVLEAATYIDDYGFISGYGIHQGVRRAFMLRPFKIQVVGTAGTKNTLRVDFCVPGELIFFAWSLRGSEGSNGVTAMPTPQAAAAMAKPAVNPQVSMTKPTASAPTIPAPDSKLSSRPITLPTSPSALRLA